MGRSVNVWMSLTACLAVVLLVGVPILEVAYPPFMNQPVFHQIFYLKSMG